mmetsp:Transcript_16849/g.46488  ORF Transcript_16849/g.46488 Transcript_16849/m.46488 type:complete len:226 (-) Transcript_16849:193-870(-)
MLVGTDGLSAVGTGDMRGVWICGSRDGERREYKACKVTPARYLLWAAHTIGLLLLPFPLPLGLAQFPWHCRGWFVLIDQNIICLINGGEEGSLRIGRSNCPHHCELTGRGFFGCAASLLFQISLPLFLHRPLKLLLLALCLLLFKHHLQFTFPGSRFTGATSFSSLSISPNAPAASSAEVAAGPIPVLAATHACTASAPCIALGCLTGYLLGRGSPRHRRGGLCR